MAFLAFIVGCCIYWIGTGTRGAHEILPAETPQQLLTKEDAEKIMGETLKLSDSVSAFANGVSSYRCSYSPVSDTRDDKAGKIYFLYESYFQLALAQKKYSATRTANKPNGIQDLEGVGEEAYFHSDNVNFYFIMIRKGNKVISMKVNKITPAASLPEFHRISRKITENL
jgi:hypothetical protein